jgi:hypothetical protein
MSDGFVRFTRELVALLALLGTTYGGPGCGGVWPFELVAVGSAGTARRVSPFPNGQPSLS